jgi:hypothetical protein
MVYKLRPLEVSFDFEDREYGLGDTIQVDIELVPNGDVTVREARVDLSCEERFVENYSVSGPGLYSNPGVASPRAQISNQVIRERKETYVHSTEVFLSDAKLTAGISLRYQARLKIQPKPPVHVEDAKELRGDADRSWTFKWTLVTTVDVVRGRNPKRQRVVRVGVE